MYVQVQICSISLNLYYHYLMFQILLMLQVVLFHYFLCVSLKSLHNITNIINMVENLSFCIEYHIRKN